MIFYAHKGSHGIMYGEYSVNFSTQNPRSDLHVALTLRRSDKGGYIKEPRLRHEEGKGSGLGWRVRGVDGKREAGKGRG